MNCPSRTDADDGTNGWNQNPPALAADLTTRNDMDHIANTRQQRDHKLDLGNASGVDVIPHEQQGDTDWEKTISAGDGKGGAQGSKETDVAVLRNLGDGVGLGGGAGGGTPSGLGVWFRRKARRVVQVLKRYLKFVGPGFLVAVAYIDPGNYATDVAAGATYRYRLLFMVLLSNIFAIFLQSLCVRLGSVTGMNLAENCKAHLPWWLNYTLYFFAECAIIATDIAEVIGTAIALKLLLNVPLVAGCAISIVDVLIILIFYRPTGSMRGVRIFEVFVMLLVIGVVVCFCFQLSLITNTTAGEVFKGYLPSSALVESKGLYQACGILGATVMPHSLYLGSGIIQSRLHDFDTKAGNIPSSSSINSFSSISSDSFNKYRPSISAIRSCMSYSIAELAISLFTFALFVNSAILIVAGSSLYNNESAESADLFGIHALLSDNLAPVAGTIFALALLLSGTSAGIVCTIAGQMVSEGQLSWTVAPWVRRLITRSISITPSIIIAGAVGQHGLSAALEGSQVALSVILPIVSAPLIYFTCRNKYMTVRDVDVGADGEPVQAEGGVKMRNPWPVAVLAGLIWGLVVVMNVALLVLVGLGKG